MDILYSINGKYLDIMLASFLSLYKNSGFNNLRVHIIYEDMTNDEIYKVEKFINDLDGVQVFLYPISDYNIERYGIPSWHGSQIANARLFFEKILKSNIDDINNILYLDADTIVKSDITDLYKYKENLICAVKDQCLKSYIKRFEILSTYFNSGVLFINVKDWIKNEVEEKIIKFLKENKLKLDFPDQDIINCIFNAMITELPLEYNLLATPYALSDFLNKLYFNPNLRNISYDEIMDAITKPKIIHAYAFSQMKPWTNNDVNPFNEYFMDYILKVNPDFKKEELTLFRKLITTNKQLFFTLLALRPYLAEKSEKGLHNLLLKINN